MADERRTQEVEASPEEARFLRRFVRRTTLPWIACVGALAGLALGVALAPPPPAPLVAEAPGAAHSSAALDKLRAELATLREEVTALRSAEPAPSPLRDDIEPRLAKLEAELAERSAHAPQMADSASGAESAGELTTIRDRLYNLETRLDSKEQERAALQKDVLARLYELERSVQSIRVDDAGPASPAPSEAPR